MSAAANRPTPIPTPDGATACHLLMAKGAALDQLSVLFTSVTTGKPEPTDAAAQIVLTGLTAAHAIAPSGLDALVQSDIYQVQALDDAIGAGDPGTADVTITNSFNTATWCSVHKFS
ncbi:hypothetical protein SAMN05892883_2861 [Jatrophihabitans sp. GAS493]|uniref:hypothetical protein n=1 Tax=Jatrophihabitans sp. GAS493 TaxID=1907575 RepID=UPI000BB91CBE|nr:hypothetical protein [Jatrophihabitans sp. GAS493]SOD73567.1 hypothetical protein SAMN05892883_2861 [Jatrophihabitans sp. GAS493]